MDIFYFSARRRGKGSPGRQARGGVVFCLLKIPKGGGGVLQRGGARGTRGREGVCGEFGGGGLIFIFFGAEMPAKVCSEDGHDPQGQKVPNA